MYLIHVYMSIKIGGWQVNKKAKMKYTRKTCLASFVELVIAVIIVIKGQRSKDSDTLYSYFHNGSQFGSACP